MRLSASFYAKDDVVAVARDLLGKVLCTRLNGQLTKAIIVETEAYAGVTDKASHAYGGRRTKRTEPIYGQGGTAYVYLCYGLHHLFNVVTNQAETPHAVLIRAGIPVTGIGRMLKRRNKEKVDKALLAGPGSLAKALGITTDHTGLSLMNGQIWIEDHGTDVADDAVTIGPRVGVDYAGEDALRPYRFRLSKLQAESLV
ncbi:putative 3-methyladenine DNA glycosylase [uncultured Woeseiaceae bacterium]|uniref:Putative 3-methyladenine DNA glycosylase n=1 Tax=uncultured Woeseiaceae bacterium TaxID=1983305 RepID=A0A7D9D2H1_9GAMM|nr:putative 3-methyladenine DNA glycosylase [uncultured Woeseiaceae bacterium]